MSATALFTVVGAFSGRVFAKGIGLDTAVGWGLANDIPRSALRDLPPQGELRSHEDARGIIIRRTS